MLQNITKVSSLISLFSIILVNSFFAQTTIEGIVLDHSTNESVIGATISIPEAGVGTATDLDGKFTLTVDMDYPITLEISAFDFEDQTIVLEEAAELISISLTTETFSIEEEVVISASRIEERILESPVSIEKYSLMKIRESAGPDVFANLANLKGIQLNTSSFSFTSVNTRGFADAQNWRFIQISDGMDINTPGLNYSFGNFIGPNELDLRNIEIVPGPGSALYGPNAFNGLLVMSSKDPFEYEGLSAMVKGGFTVQEANGTNPFGDFAMRYAKVFNEKWAVKVNLGYLTATDWAANDDSYHITPQNVFRKDQLLSLPRSHPNFNAVNVYGDEVVVPVYITPDSMINVNRSGIREADIVNYQINNFKGSAAIHYKPTEKVEAIYDFKYSQGDAILRHTTIYPLRDIRHIMNKFEIRGDDFNVKAYHSYEDANNSYVILGTGAFIQEGLKSSAAWSMDYGAAYRGEVPGIAAGDHAAARSFADRDIKIYENGQIQTELFSKLRDATLTNPDILTGGSRFIDRTSFFHAEANYDFTGKIGFFDLQEGISYRRYSLVSDGRLYNDGELGFNGPIPIEEYGAYAQASKKLFQDHLAIRTSLRIDKNQNFEARVSPRGSMVLTLGKERQHNFRVSAQTGFRNPATQETYISLDIGDAVILGGTEDNVYNYNYKVSEDKIVNGRDIHEQLVTIPSLQAFLASGGTNPSVLQLSRFDFLRQEKISTLEIGYKALWGNNLLVDANVYFNRYTDFVSRNLGYSLLVNRAFAVYTNIPDEITSFGAAFQMEYLFPKGYRLWGNYAYADFDADMAVKNNPGFFPGFNTPKHRFNFTVSNRDIYKGLGASASFRWSDGYLWQSPFGEGEINAFSVLDAAIFYRIEPAKSTLKIGAANLLNQEYKVIYGGPQIGSQFYMSLTFDEFAR